VNLQQVITRDLDPTEPAVVTIGIFRAGVATNIIPDTATIEGTARTLSEAARKLVHQRIESRCAAIAESGKCELRFTWIDGYPPTVNDPQMADFVAKIARQEIGAESFIPVGRPSMGGEDFAYYLEKIPGCFFLVGVQPAGRDSYPSLHSDHYDFTDDALAVGVRMFVKLAMNFKA
jgi:amidohydrolase